MTERPAEPLLLRDDDGLRAEFVTVIKPARVGDKVYELFAPTGPEDLLDIDDFNRSGRIPYWADIWPSAVVLAEKLAGETGDGRRLLELGCGLGLAALVAVEAGFHVTATDYFHEALEFVASNAARHNIPLPTLRLVDWREFPCDLTNFDVVAGGDVLYEKPYNELVAAVIVRSLAPYGVAYIADPNRTAAQGFPDACTQAGLTCRRVLQKKAAVSGTEQTVNLFEIRHGSASG